jgi:Transposase
MEAGREATGPFVIGGVDTHKDLHVAAVVNEHDRVLGSQCFATTRHGYKQMLAWMRSFGPLRRVGVEATGTYGAGLLRYLQNAGVEVLEVTAPDRHETAAGAARTTTWTPRTPPTRPSPASAPSRPRAATA